MTPGIHLNVSLCVTVLIKSDLRRQAVQKNVSSNAGHYIYLCFEACLGYTEQLNRHSYRLSNESIVWERNLVLESTISQNYSHRIFQSGLSIQPIHVYLYPRKNATKSRGLYYKQNSNTMNFEAHKWHWQSK